MTWAALIELLGGKRAAAFAALATLLLVVAGIQTIRVEYRSGKIERLETAEKLWRSANEANQNTIKKLQAANADWARAADARTKAAALAVASVAAERDRLQAELNQRRRDRGHIYDRNPEAAAWGRERVPAAVADQLRNTGRSH